MRKATIIFGVVAFLLFICYIIYDMMGAGGFKRMVTLTGIYAVCKPQGYPALCFLDADSKDGGLSCIPYIGDCKK